MPVALTTRTGRFYDPYAYLHSVTPVIPGVRGSNARLVGIHHWGKDAGRRGPIREASSKVTKDLSR